MQTAQRSLLPFRQKKLSEGLEEAQDYAFVISAGKICRC